MEFNKKRLKKNVFQYKYLYQLSHGDKYEYFVEFLGIISKLWQVTVRNRELEFSSFEAGKFIAEHVTLLEIITRVTIY
jgi:hypothetical protein